MKKLFFAFACTVLLASCASTPQNEETVVQNQPIAPTVADTPAMEPAGEAQTDTLADTQERETAATIETGGTREADVIAKSDDMQTDGSEIITTTTDDTETDDDTVIIATNDPQTNEDETVIAEHREDESDAQQTDEWTETLGSELIIIAESDDGQSLDIEIPSDNADPSTQQKPKREEPEATIAQNANTERDDVIPSQIVDSNILDVSSPNTDSAYVRTETSIAQLTPTQTDATAAEREVLQDVAQDAESTNGANNSQNATPSLTESTPQPAEKESASTSTSNGNNLARSSVTSPAQNETQDSVQNAVNPPKSANTTANQQPTHNTAQSTTQRTVSNPAQGTANSSKNTAATVQQSSASNVAQSTAPATPSPAQGATTQPSAPLLSAAYTQNADDTLSATLIPLQNQSVTPSRTVGVKNNQYLDVVYPGSGWVYLGEAEENRDKKKDPLFSYFGRKLGTTDTTFSLRSRKPGKTLLHFYKNDALTGQYIDDYLEVDVGDESAAPGQRVTAPSYAQVVPPKPSRQTRQSYENTGLNETTSTPQARDSGRPTEKSPTQTSQKQQSDAERAPSANATPSLSDRGIRTNIQTTESVPGSNLKSPSPASSYGGTATASKDAAATAEPQDAIGESDANQLDQARRAYAAKQYETALAYVQQYLANAATDIDEALFLQGQILEADSNVKNVRAAIDAYETLTKNYPMSALWTQANNRTIYLKRFYIDIR